MHSNPRRATSRRVQPGDLNLAVVIGTVANEPVHRQLADGSVIVQFDLRTNLDGAGATGTVSVPAAWRDPSASSIDTLQPEMRLIAVGRVERRFFRSGGSTQSRTELVVERCLPVRRTKSVRALIAKVAAQLVDADGDAGAAASGRVLD